MPSVHVFEITDANFEAKVLKAKLPVLVDFWATWCPPCKALTPQIEALAERYAGKLLVGKVDVDGNVDVPKQFKIASVPSLLMFRAGRVVWTQVGVIPRRKFEATIEELLDQ